MVDKGTKGFRIGKKENKLGLRASDTSELIFEDCEIPAENLLGKEGDGFIDAMQVLDGGRISIAALGLGMAQGAYEAALKYSKERKQFGKAISEFQAIAVEAGGHGDGDRCGAAADHARGLDERCRHEDHAGVVDGEAVHQRGRGEGARTKACRFTAAMGSSRTIRRRSFIAT